MEKLKDLKDLLLHEIQDLYSAEEQIIEALPLMIKKANNAKLVKALKDHLKVTELQRARLDEVRKLFNAEPENGASKDAEKKGFLGGLFGGGKQVCRGMRGLIEEGNKVMSEDMSPTVLDAAIIACAQKIEHYEICGYGTARAYARELNLGDVAERLEETLDEEYEADDLLTDLAVGGLNEEAETGVVRAGRSGRANSASRKKGNTTRAASAKKSAPSKSGAGTAKSGSSGSSSKSSLKTSKVSSGGRGSSNNSGSSKSKSGPLKGGKRR